MFNQSRRHWMQTCGMGFGGLALANMLQDPANAEDSGGAMRTHFPGRAKHIIHVFLNGGVSQVDTFDPKPELTKYGGKSINETPHKETQNPEKLKLARVTVVNDANGLGFPDLTFGTNVQRSPQFTNDYDIGLPGPRQSAISPTGPDPRSRGGNKLEPVQPKPDPRFFQDEP